MTKRLLPAFLVAVAAGGVLVRLSFTQEAATPSASSPETAQILPAGPIDVNAAFAAGKQLQDAGQHALALEQYGRILQRDPQSHAAAIRAGSCLRDLNRWREAAVYYERAAAGPPGEFRTVGLACAAECYKALGDTAKALQLARQARAEDPIGKWGRRALAAELEIQGATPQTIQARVAREESAANRYRQGRDLMRAGQHEAAIRVLEEVLTQLRDTGGAFQALSAKAEALWHLKRYEEVCTTYAELRDRIKSLPTPRDWHGMFQTMDYRVGWYRATQLSKELLRKRARSDFISDDQWDRLRVLCERWRANATDPADQAEAQVTAIESWAHQGKHEDALKAAQAFLKESDGKENLPSLDSHGRVAANGSRTLGADWPTVRHPVR